MKKLKKTYDMNIYENEEALPYSCQIPRGKLFYIIAEKSTLDTKKSFFILYLIKKYIRKYNLFNYQGLLVTAIYL